MEKLAFEAQKVSAPQEYQGIDILPSSAESGAQWNTNITADVRSGVFSVLPESANDLYFELSGNTDVSLNKRSNPNGFGTVGALALGIDHRLDPLRIAQTVSSKVKNNSQSPSAIQQKKMDEMLATVNMKYEAANDDSYAMRA